MFFNRWYTQKEDGYVVLLGVLIVGAIGISVMLSLLLLGLGSSRTSFAEEQSFQAKALANACAEEGLQQIRDTTSYTGSGGLTIGQGACTYAVTSQGGSNRTVAATGTVGTMTRRVTVIINAITPLITATSWQEV
ncbi:MAG: hypothetical protein WCG84_02325 [Candidatus Moraniibacteriota bacterium]